MSLHTLIEVSFTSHNATIHNSIVSPILSICWFTWRGCALRLLPLSASSSLCRTILRLMTPLCPFFMRLLLDTGDSRRDPMCRSHYMIVQTLDDVTAIVSVTPMHPLRHTTCTDGSTAGVLCSTLQHAAIVLPLMYGDTAGHLRCKSWGLRFSLFISRVTSQILRIFYSPSSPSTTKTASHSQN